MANHLDFINHSHEDLWSRVWDSPESPESPYWDDSPYWSNAWDTHAHTSLFPFFYFRPFPFFGPFYPFGFFPFWYRRRFFW